MLDQYLACCQQCSASDAKLATLIGDKRRRLLIAGDERRSVNDNKPQRYTEDNRTSFNCTQ